jgi:hypothetical protein
MPNASILQCSKAYGNNISLMNMVLLENKKEIYFSNKAMRLPSSDVHPG